MKDQASALYVFVSAIERGADVQLFHTMEAAVAAAMDEATNEWDSPEDWPDELVAANEAHLRGDHMEAAEMLEEHYEANGLDDEFITITIAPMPGHTLEEMEAV